MNEFRLLGIYFSLFKLEEENCFYSEFIRGKIINLCLVATLSRAQLSIFIASYFFFFYFYFPFLALCVMFC